MGLLPVLIVSAAAAVAASAASSGGNADCLGCHGLEALRSDDERTVFVDAATFGRSVHGRLACAACHAGAARYPHGPIAPVLCEGCHAEPRRFEGRFHRTDFLGAALFPSREGTYVLAARAAAPAPSTPDAACRRCHDDDRAPEPEPVPEGSPHAARRCAECHVDAARPHDAPDAPKPAPVECGRCHVDEAGGLARAAHGARRAEGDTGAPGCASCHGTHDIRGVEDPASPVHPTRIAETCLRCHGVAAFAAARGIDLQISAESYAASVHGRSAPERNLAVAATCVDCHGAHAIRPRSDDASEVGARHLAATCGRCHEKEAAEYVASAHGRALARGAHEVPTCSDCHGEHGILPHGDPRSTTSRLQSAQSLCLGCHDRPALQEKFGLPARRGSTYLDSYHGLATRGRSTAAAVCVDCHGVHLILASGDTAAATHPSNRVATCGRCHPDATARFASFGDVHFSYGDHWITRLVRFFYQMMITGTLGGMAVWVTVLTLPAIRRRLEAARAGSPVRFLLAEIAQHAALAVSFILLAVTGLALAFPDSYWVGLLAAAGLDEALRGLLHRIAGVVLIGAAAAHVAYLLGTSRGRWLLKRMFPALGDARAARDHIFHAVGLRTAHPHFTHFSYFEKAEYWALVWGTIVMAATGVVLWFPEPFPRLLVAVAEAIHFYEAILAVGAILVWHSYFVFFDPEVFPFNPAILLGRAARGTETADRTEPFDEPPKDRP